MSAVNDLHAAVRQGNLPALRALLEQHPGVANELLAPDVRR